MGAVELRWRRAFASVEDELLTDAVAALQLLRRRPEVDPARLFVIGHSLGALLTPELAQRGGGVAGLVLLAPPGRPLLGMPAGYWRDLDQRDEMAIAVTLGRPVLLLRGSRDRNVTAVDQARWVAALSDRVSVKSATLPESDHLFCRPLSEPSSGTSRPKPSTQSLGSFSTLNKFAAALHHPQGRHTAHAIHAATLITLGTLASDGNGKPVPLRR